MSSTLITATIKQFVEHDSNEDQNYSVCASVMKRIPPPFPDPRLWTAVAEHQQQTGVQRWLVSKKFFPPSIHCTLNPIQKSIPTIYPITPGYEEKFRTTSDVLLPCEGNFTTDHVEDYQCDEEETEELVLDDYWAERLSNTMKRLEKKRHKSAVSRRRTFKSKRK